MSIWDDISNFVSKVGGDITGNNQPQPQTAPKPVIPQKIAMQPQQTAGIFKPPQNNPNNTALPQNNNLPYNQTPAIQGGGVPSNDLSQTGNVLKGIGEGAISAPKYFLNADIINPGKAAIAQATGNKQALANANQAQNQTLGLGAKGTNLKGALKKLGGNTLNLASYAIPGGEVLGDTAPAVAKVATGAAIYGGANAGQTALEGGTKKQVLQSGLQGTLTGGLGQGVHEVGKAANNAIPKVYAAPSSPEEYANAFGVTPEQAKIEMAKASNPPQIPRTPVPETKAEMVKQQMTPQRPVPPEVNTARNPYKAPIPEVKAGDYGQVISNEQTASNPVLVAGKSWSDSMKKLAKAAPEDFKNFWKRVENPNSSTKITPELKDAISKWKTLTDRVHGTSQALGGNTNYLNDYALHPWDLPEGYGEHVTNGGDKDNFQGLNNIQRKYRTIAEGEKNGLTLKSDPVKEGENFYKASASLLKRRAIVKGITEADRDAVDKTNNFSIGKGKDNSIDVSDEAKKQLKGLKYSPATNSKIIKGLRTANTGLKGSILSAGQFHPINIGVLRAFPTLLAPKPSTLLYKDAEGNLKIDPTMSSHPIRAVQGVTGMFRNLFPGGRANVDRTMARAIADGTDVKAAKIGMPYGVDASDNEGSFIKGGVGHKTVFGKQMPEMHDKVARSIISDLEKRGISLDSKEARTAGKAGNNLMGFVNTEAQRIPPQVNRSLGDWLLAKQFTHSKFSQDLTAVTKGNVGGAYARANVLGNVAASTAIIAGIGYAVKQKSDDIKDMLLRALINPSSATPNQSTPKYKGDSTDTLEERLPGTDTSDLSKILGISLVREKNGHLGVSWNLSNLPSGVASFLTARLSPLASAGVQLKTNKTFAGYPLYSTLSGTKAGTKAEQAGTSIVSNLLPIGLQGLPQTNVVEKHLPGNIQNVLNAQKPGTNPLLKSIGSSFGVTTQNDPTVGKDLQANQYYQELGTASKGLNTQELAALNLNTASKKDPVTGKYVVNPSVWDSVARASALLQNPTVINRLITMNQNLAKQGQKVDPLWLQSPAKIKSYLQYEAISDKPDAQSSNWLDNNPWYDQGSNSLLSQRNAFYASLPPGDPNKPLAPIEFPQPNAQTTNDMNTWNGLLKTDSTSAEQFLLAHQDVQTQLDNQAAYDNQVLVARGYGALRTYPTPPASVSAKLNSINSNMTSKQKAAIYNQPDVAAWMQQDAVYNLTKGAALAQIQGNSPSSKTLGAVNDLSYDIVKNPDGTYSLKYNDTQGGTGGGGSTPAQTGAIAVNGSSSSSSSAPYLKLSQSLPISRLRLTPMKHIKYQLARDYYKGAKIRAKVPQGNVRPGKLTIGNY